MLEVSKSEFKPKALQIMRDIQESQKGVIITDRGKPVLEIRPIKSHEQGPLDKLKGSVVEYKNPEKPAFDESDWDLI